MAENEKIYVINFVSGINLKSVASLVEFTCGARNNKASKIILNISSVGGDLAPAFGAYYHLRSLGIPLASYNIGNVESSAVLLYLAADTRLAAPYSRFLLHGFAWQSVEQHTRSNLREKLASLDFDSERYRDIFNERTEGAESPIDISKALNDETMIVSASSAVSAGICTSVNEPTVPAGAILWHITTPYV
jgi:ATP-dependent protease ClpP protease subunit